MLEALSYTDNAFVTLTYEDKKLPCINSQPTVLPEHLTLFLKRMRDHYQRYQFKIHKELKINEPFEEWEKKFRFYAVGEYGTKSGRPHYHVVLFNFPTCVHGRTLRDLRSGAADWSRCCSRCQLVGKAWGKGLVELGTVERGSAKYICENYITKNMRRNDDPRLRAGQHREFSQMSRMPGIGQPSLWEYADALLSLDGTDRMPDVPAGVRLGKVERGTGRYLRQSLRAFIGREKNAPLSTIQELQAQLLPMREAAVHLKTSTKEVIKKVNEGKRINSLARKALFNRKGEI